MYLKIGIVFLCLTIYSVIFLNSLWAIGFGIIAGYNLRLAVD